MDGFTKAITKLPSANMGGGQTSGLYGAPDIEKALGQHLAYRSALSASGLEVTVLEPDPRFPDSTFVEDTAVVLPEAAIIMSPGHATRAGETEAVREALSGHRDLVELDIGVRIDGGDVLQADRRFYVGLSDRTDRAGAESFARAVADLGYSCTPSPVEGFLHLKSAVNYLGGGWMIADERYSGAGLLERYDVIPVPSDEGYAANSLMVNGTVLVPEGFPQTLRRLEENGFRTLTLQMSEFMKMDGGLSCLSLRF